LRPDPQENPTRRTVEDARRSPEGPRDLIAVIVRSPRSAYVYWRLRSRRAAELARLFGAECRWFLRITDRTTGVCKTVSVAPEKGNCYADVEPGAVYDFTLVAGMEGTWRAVCSTGRVAMPPIRPARAVEPAGPAASRRAPRELLPGLTFESTPRLPASSPGGKRQLR